MEKILIFGIAGVGNLLLFLPVLDGLRSLVPQANITLLISPNGADALVENTQLADEVRVFPWYKWLGKSQGSQTQSLVRLTETVLRLRLRQYDISLWPCVIHTTVKMEFLSFLVGAKRRVLHAGRYPQLNTCVPMPPRTHLVQHNINLLRALGMEVSVPDEVRLPLSDRERDEGRALLRSMVRKNVAGYIGFQPGGNTRFDPYRQWPPRKFTELADRLVEFSRMAVLLFGSTGERPLLESIAAQMQHQAIVITSLNLRQVAALISQLNLFIANDSGLMHLASAVGTRVLGILGPTDPYMTGPWGPRAHVIRLNLPCSPCYVQGYQRVCPHRACLNALSVDHVFEVAANLLEAEASGSLAPKYFDIEEPAVLPLARRSLSGLRRRRGSGENLS